MLDEAQDISDGMADIVLGHTSSRIIIVGDPHQSFRFGMGIASIANTLLSNLEGEKRPLLGSLALFNKRPGQVMLIKREAREWMLKSPDERGDYTSLSRTNGGLIKEALVATARGERVEFRSDKVSFHS
eukprot:jgi/Undpi1/13068/HiC_scaffold_8.g02730.m1